MTWLYHSKYIFNSLHQNWANPLVYNKKVSEILIVFFRFPVLLLSIICLCCKVLSFCNHVIHECSSEVKINKKWNKQYHKMRRRLVNSLNSTHETLICFFIVQYFNIIDLSSIVFYFYCIKVLTVNCYPPSFNCWQPDS